LRTAPALDALELGSRLTLIVRPRPRASTETAALPLLPSKDHET
jgi:hypothetical protein